MVNLELAYIMRCSMNSNRVFKYDAFISYRHCEPDKSVAEKLHRMLEGFRIPKSIAESCGKKQIRRVFRDRDELPTSSNLADNITEALRDSEYLIVVCSPRTSQSKWVLKEIEDFKEIHGHNKILALLIEGDPQESFPEQLCYVKKHGTYENLGETETIVRVEPLAADIRASSNKEMYKNLRTEILRLLSPMLNCSYDDLKQRHRERRIKAILTTSILISAFFIVFGAVSMYQSMLISQKNLEISKKNDEIVAQIQKNQISQSRYLADISGELLEEGDRYRAILVACEALPKDLENPDRPYVEEAEYALAKALGVYDIDSMYDMDVVLDHNKPVSYMELSPDGKTLLTLSEDGYSRMWNTEDGKCLGEYYTDHKMYAPDDIATFVDNSTIIVAGNDDMICFDDKGNLRWRRKILANSISVSDADKLVTIDYHQLVVMNASTGSTILEIDLDKHIDLTTAGNYISCISLSKAGNLIGVGTSFGQVFLFSAATGELIRSYNTEFDYVTSLAFSPEGHFAVASNELDDLLGKGKGTLNIFMAQGEEFITSDVFSHSAINDVKFYPYDSNLIILTEGEKLNVFDMKSGQTVFSFISGDSISDYEIFDGFIVTSSLDGSIRFCFLQDSGYESDWHRIMRPNPITGLEIGTSKIAITCSNSKKVYVMKVLSNENTIKLAEHNDSIRTAIFSPDGSLSLSSSTNGELMLCSIPDRKTMKSISLDGRISGGKIISKNRILTVLEDGRVLLLDRNLELIKQEDCGYISLTCFNMDNSLFAISSGGEITVFSSEKLDIVASIKSGYSSSCSFTSDNCIMIVNKGETAKLIDLNSGLETLLEADNGIIAGTINSDGNKYVLAYDDKTIRLYDTLDRQQEPITLKGQANKAVSLAFSPDSGLLFVGYDDSSIEVFDGLEGNLLMVYSSEYMGSPLARIVVSSDGNQVVCIDEYKNAIFISASTLKILASANVSDIDGDFSKIISYYNSDLLLLPVYSTGMLYDEAQKQLNGRILTDREKVDMFIE